MVEASILLASSRGQSYFDLKEAATAYKVDTDATALKDLSQHKTEEGEKRRDP
jgi:ParB family chromosome partitioning protein